MKWQESENKKDSQGKDYTENTDYTAQETYYENQYYLFGSANGMSFTKVSVLFYFLCLSIYFPAVNTPFMYSRRYRASTR